MYPLTVVYPNRVIKAYVAQLQAQHNRSEEMQLLHTYYHDFKFPGGWLQQCTSTILRQEWKCRDKLTIPWVITDNHTPKGLLISCGLCPGTRCQFHSQILLKYEYCITQAFTQLWATHTHSPTFLLKSIEVLHYLYAVAEMLVWLLATIKLRLMNTSLFDQLFLHLSSHLLLQTSNLVS